LWPAATGYIFVSHSASDGATLASQLADALEASGVRCWVAPRDVELGESYPAQIGRAVRKCRGLVLVLTVEANFSPGVIREVELADKANKPMVPLIVDGTRPSDGLSYFVSSQQQIAWTDATAAAEALVEVFGPTSQSSNGSDTDLPRKTDRGQRRPFLRLELSAGPIRLILIAGMVATVGIWPALLDRNHFDPGVSKMSTSTLSSGGSVSQALSGESSSSRTSTSSQAPSRPSISGLSAGDTFRDCQDICPEMVVIPPGSFLMGSPENKARHERPRHRVRIAYTFAVSKYPITRGEWKQFATETSYPYNTNCPSGADDYPIECVSWRDAVYYVAWMSRKTGRSYRLLTEAEWEYTARAGAGDVPPMRLGLNAFGVADMPGEYVWTWTQDCWHDNYDGAPTDGSAWVDGANCLERVVRGWRDSLWRDHIGFFKIFYNVGLRVATDDDRPLPAPSTP
jgi:formylglycine-generating enzyme required for sulfatase activity